MRRISAVSLWEAMVWLPYDRHLTMSLLLHYSNKTTVKLKYLSVTVLQESLADCSIRVFETIRMESNLI